MSKNSMRELNANKNDGLREGWVVRKSTSRDKNYYFNQNTGESTWTKPQNSVIEDRPSSSKIQCSRTENTMFVRSPQENLPKLIPLPGSSKQEKSWINPEKTLSSQAIANVAKKVSFSFKQKPSLPKTSNIFSNEPNTSCNPGKSCNNSDRICHGIISGNVTKSKKKRRKAKSLDANVMVNATREQEIPKVTVQSPSSSKKVIGDGVILTGPKPSMSSQPVNERYHKKEISKSPPPPPRRHSLPHLKPENSCSSSRSKLSQAELVRRYDKAHSSKVLKPKKEDDVLLGKRKKDERTSSVKINAAAVPCKDREEIDMEWEDIENEKVLLNIQEHRQQYQEMKCENFASPPVDMEVQYFDFSDNDNRDCVIVLDTNVLISDVKFVERLIENEFKGSEHPTIVIPWMVLKELDALKGKSVLNKSALERNARRAIQFIHKCFNSHSPWVKGQSAVDDKDECFKVDSPDDSILNCCLQLLRKNKKVILLSNDVNLCNKAIANDVKSFGKQQLEEKMQHESLGLLFGVDFKPRKVNSCDQEPAKGRSHLSVTKTKEEPPRPEVIFSKFQSLLHQFLSKLLETEMESVFEGLWLKVVYLKPPWSLTDLLQCFSKHWRAVFCFVMDNRAEHRVDDLITFFKRSVSGQIKNIEEAINCALSLCYAINSKKYCDLASEYQNQFQALLKEDDKVEEDVNESQDLASSSSLPSPDSNQDSLEAAVVLEAFQIVLGLVNNFCGVLCDVLGISVGINYEKPDRQISWDEVEERLPMVNKCLEDLISCMRSVLEVQECYLTVQHPTLLGLRASLLAVIPSDNQIVGAISCERLRSFVVGEKTRVMLTNGMNQFLNYQLLLAKVINGEINR